MPSSNNSKKTKTDRLVNALISGKKLTSNQIMTKYGFASTNSARAAISDLREEGYPVQTIVTRTGHVQYHLG